jgi:hypothetical protein
VRLETHRRLQDLAEQTGQEYGKLVQKLLAIAFCESGATRVTERSIQGIDLEVALPDGRALAFEVKTTLTGEVAFGKKDVKGLEARAGQGLTPYFAVLGPRLVDDWVLARLFPAEIQSDRGYSPTRLRAYRDTGLEQLIGVRLEDAVNRHAHAAMKGGQGALDALLKGHACYAVA